MSEQKPLYTYAFLRPNSSNFEILHQRSPNGRVSLPVFDTVEQAEKDYRSRMISAGWEEYIRKTPRDACIHKIFDISVLVEEGIIPADKLARKL